MIGGMDTKYILVGAALVGVFGGSIWANVSTRGQSSPVDTVSSAPSSKVQQIAAKLVRYSGCNEVRALGKDPLYRGDPGYREEMDGDGDGVACEPIRY